MQRYQQSALESSQPNSDRPGQYCPPLSAAPHERYCFDYVMVNLGLVFLNSKIHHSGNAWLSWSFVETSRVFVGAMTFGDSRSPFPPSSATAQSTLQLQCCLNWVENVFTRIPMYVRNVTVLIFDLFDRNVVKSYRKSFPRKPRRQLPCSIYPQRILVVQSPLGSAIEIARLL
jgi:hypothetical protein